MTPDSLSSVPIFTCHGVKFLCWIVDNGDRYEWRAEGLPIAVGRCSGSAQCWAKVGSDLIGNHFHSLRHAMAMAVQEFASAARGAAE